MELTYFQTRLRYWVKCLCDPFQEDAGKGQVPRFTRNFMGSDHLRQSLRSVYVYRYVYINCN